MKTILSGTKELFFFFFLLLHTIPLNGCAITHLSSNDGHLGCLKCFAVPLKFFIDIAKLSFTEILWMYTSIRASLVAQQWRICLQCRRPEFDPWVGKIPWRRAWQPTCLENPMDRGAWWAAIYGVAQSQTWLKRLSSSSSSILPPIIYEFVSPHFNNTVYYEKFWSLILW